MANTTWIHQIKNHSRTPIAWINQENTKFQGVLNPFQDWDYQGAGFCFPWVDHTKPQELKKAIKFFDPRNKVTLFLIFQSFNRDTIQWMHPMDSYSHRAVDAYGPAGAGGIKHIQISEDHKPHLTTRKAG